MDGTLYPVSIEMKDPSYGYIIKRNNKDFHEDVDIVCQELHEFIVSLYDASSGRTCQAKNSEFEQIKASKTVMFLIEQIEINQSYKRIDMDINVIHEILNHVKNDVGACVLDPTR